MSFSGTNQPSVSRLTLNVSLFDWSICVSMITLFFSLSPCFCCVCVLSPSHVHCVSVCMRARACVRVCVQTAEVEIEETVVVQEVSKAAKAGLVPPVKQEAKSKEAKRESASSESESEEEAEYRPNVSVSFSDARIPEEDEEEDEKEKEEAKEVAKEEVDTTAAASDANVLLVAAGREEEPRTEEEEARAPPLEELKEVKKEAEEITDDLMLTPEETPNGLAQPEEGLLGPEEEQTEPRVNGEASLGGAEPRPQVICCSEVKSSPDPASAEPQLPPASC